MKGKEIEGLAKIHLLIKKHKDILKPYYPEDTSFKCAFDYEENKLLLFIPTKYKKLPNRKLLGKIREIFNADDCIYIPGEKRPYWKGKTPYWLVEWQANRHCPKNNSFPAQKKG